jgi:exodeoxyribonuclease VII small subunit
MAQKKVEKEDGPDRFEEYLEELRSVVEKMEEGGLGLEESLKLFEEGINLSRLLFGILNRAEGQVEELLKTMERVPFNRGEE